MSSWNLLPVNNPKNTNLGSHDLVCHPVVPDPEFPIPLQGPFQRRPILLGSLDQAGSNCSGDSTVDILGNPWQVLLHNLGVIEEGKWHLALWRFQVRPDLFMGQSLLTVKRLLTLLSENGKRAVLLRLQGFFDQVSDLQRKRHAVSLRPPAQPFIQGSFHDDIDSGIFCRHDLHLEV